MENVRYELEDTSWLLNYFTATSYMQPSQNVFE